MSSVCCLLPAVCCLLSVVYFLLSAVCCLLSATTHPPILSQKDDQLGLNTFLMPVFLFCVDSLVMVLFSSGGDGEVLVLVSAT